MQIVPGDLDHPAIIDLLKFHLDTNIAVTPPGSVHALDLDGLKVPDVAFFAGWKNGDSTKDLLVIGAVKEIAPEADGRRHGEIKSMRTVEAHRGNGLGAVMLDHLMDHARINGIERLSLETGSFDYFEPARKLYEKRGFGYCEPFGDYVLDPNSVFMTKVL
ncbi:MAG: GNAT family N-acetyltransferase [Rhizobiales bacterium]|nr:GNAT family N-acetyltransferase [Hyphomicrobiales bacterium]MBO6700051.1 GNAT family N-acetyltransferase [Hyphomicrobiales bacterium]MBO6737784.1 GNAT family N-acetyltransferase [Hyphomicrobiales bacterium]MBO6913159.1 GNAT family N-acetyltransferase [Hyphomicrobiales bacterium]MBO6954203.1 GNAT family N-acetyltransferase [Hyphomicrobiales bacterium]